MSISRRTDVPAFYMPWFLNRIKEGYVLTRNPFNRKQISRISLGDASCYVFWTKNPHQLLKHYSEIDKPFMVHITITPYMEDIEAINNKSKIIEDTIALAKLIGRERVFWRYDPILFNDKYNQAYHLKYFEKLCQYFHGHVETCIFSFVEVYAKVKRALSEIEAIEEKVKYDFVYCLKDIANKYGITLKSCGDYNDIEKASCINQEVLMNMGITGYKKDKNQRDSCNCVESVDIGTYNTCLHGCIYCYANHNHDKAKDFYKNFDQMSPILGSPLIGDETIKDKIIKIDNQIKLDLE